MIDRFLAWLGAGLLTAGVSAALIAGGGVAAAETESVSDAAGATSSESTNSTGKKPDSEDGSKPDPKKDDTTDEPAGTADPSENDTEPGTDDQRPADEVPEDSAPTDEDTPTVSDTATNETPEKGSDHKGTGPTADATADGLDKSATTLETTMDAAENAEDAVTDTQDSDVPPQTEATTTQAAQTGPVEAAVAAAEANQTSLDTPLASAAAEPAAASTGPTLINIVGTFFWGLFDLVSKMLDFPPVVPPGSTVTAGRSTLQIDCGDGYTADADWYFPTEGEPDKFIYFQHGFPGRAGFYNLTLAELAERNNAVVVAPSITANYFACDGCNLTSDPMHAAVARLFEGDRAALLASAQAAGYEGTLPEQFVISGQSAGGILAAGTAGYFEQFAPADEKSNMAGVLLFDTSATGGALARALDKLPATLPVLHIAAAPAPLNTYGNANQVLVEKRPGQFNGVQLVGGTHADAFRSSVLLGIPQFVVGLVTGPSTPENVEAVHVLAQGWMTDMYAGRVYDPATRTGIYGDPGDPGEVVIDVPTDAGLAHGYVLPGPTPRLTLIDLLILTLVESPTAVNFANCAEDPSASAAAATCGAASASPVTAA